MTLQHAYAIEMARQRQEQVKSDYPARRRIGPAKRRRSRLRITWHRGRWTHPLPHPQAVVGLAGRVPMHDSGVLATTPVEARS
jgi:hypothetical protein